MACMKKKWRKIQFIDVDYLIKIGIENMNYTDTMKTASILTGNLQTIFPVVSRNFISPIYFSNRYTVMYTIACLDNNVYLS